MKALRGWICLFFWLWPVLAFAQQYTPAEPPAPARPVAAAGASHQITLDVVVSDKSGRPVSGLQQQDFTLLDNKQAQQILTFQAVDSAAAGPPVRVVLLVDEVNTPLNDLAPEWDQIGQFLRQNGGHLAQPVSLAFASDQQTTVGSTSSQDGSTLIAELTQTKMSLRTVKPSQGLSGAGDRMQTSLRALWDVTNAEAGKPGRKLVIWISPGWPMLSGAGFDLSSKVQQQVFSTIVGVSDRLRQTRITLYSIDPLGPADSRGESVTYYKGFLKGVEKANYAEFGNLGLQVLASQSGGRVLNSGNDIVGEITSCVADANAYYVLSFGALTGNRPNEYHALEIRIDKPGLTARTRSGYYAQPAQHRTP